MIFKDYYKILGLQSNRVTMAEIKTAYREQAKKLSDFKHCICKILMSCETEIQIDSLARMLIVGELSPAKFVERYYDRING